MMLCMGLCMWEGEIGKLIVAIVGFNSVGGANCGGDTVVVLSSVDVVDGAFTDGCRYERRCHVHTFWEYD